MSIMVVPPRVREIGRFVGQIGMADKRGLSDGGVQPTGDQRGFPLVPALIIGGTVIGIAVILLFR